MKKVELREVRILAPVTVRSCHLRFSGEAGEDQYRRRSHLLERAGRKVGVYWLEGETMFKGGEVIETDFEFPKAMRDKARYTDEPEDELGDELSPEGSDDSDDAGDGDDAADGTGGDDDTSGGDDGEEKSQGD